ncbi:MAG: hypothetical protein IJR88_00755 [Clostridia bacterium]|nr:hypothetical protein [Clostridia bacterium]
MKTICKILILTVLALSLVLALLSCTNKEGSDNDDSWITQDITVDEKGNYARPAEQDESDAASAQSGTRVSLPTIPLD